MKKLLTLTTALCVLGAGAALAEDSGITEAEVLAAQEAWGNGIVFIGEAKDMPEEAKARASNHLDTLYAYDMGTVLFKPTLAADDQFRGTKEEALSYFVGGSIEEDNGFAIAPYTNVRFENEGIVIDGDSAVAMGNYFFTKTDGEDVKVEYTFGYVEDEEGNLKINVHHSSLPYSAE